MEISQRTRQTTSVDDLIFDVGLHNGEDSAFYLAKGYRVVAFEADPGLASAGRKRFADEIANERMTIVEGAIGTPDQETPGNPGHVRFYRHPTLSMWGTTDQEWVSRRTQTGEFEPFDVPLTNFGECLSEYGVPHFMKIDIEGADRLCLEALHEFAARPRFVSIESEKSDFDELRAEFELLEALGYGNFAVVQQSRIAGSRIRTSARDGHEFEYVFETDASGCFGAEVGPWVATDAALDRYRKIFRDYRWFGEESMVRRVRIGRIVMARLPRYIGRPLPGWYDTHAMLVDES